MIEVAMVVPLLATLVLGVAELGFHVRDMQRITAASQAGARVVSSEGDARLADFDALMTMAAPLSDIAPADIERIIVFLPESDGGLPLGCDTSSILDKCNHYDGNSLALTTSSFTGTIDCGVFDPDRFWCPLDRETDQGAGTDWIGVRVEVRHDSVAPFLPDRTITDTTIMRIEPRFEP
ncbi:MAG: pilus assembly protein [Acidimicrobiales bacterium]